MAPFTLRNETMLLKIVESNADVDDDISWNVSEKFSVINPRLSWGELSWAPVMAAPNNACIILESPDGYYRATAFPTHQPSAFAIGAHQIWNSTVIAIATTHQTFFTALISERAAQPIRGARGRLSDTPAKPQPTHVPDEFADTLTLLVIPDPYNLEKFLKDHFELQFQSGCYAGSCYVEAHIIAPSDVGKSARPTNNFHFKLVSDALRDTLPASTAMYGHRYNVYDHTFGYDLGSVYVESDPRLPNPILHLNIAREGEILTLSQ